MSVYIKGMEMPTKCEECEWSTTDRCGFFGCRLTGNIVIRKREQDRPNWCPLVPVPPHGRLIDADALKESIKEARKAQPEIADVYDDDYFLVAEWLASSPTIIPASGGNEDE